MNHLLSLIQPIKNTKKEETSHLWVLLKSISNQPSLVSDPTSISDTIKLIFHPGGERVRKVVRRSNYRQTGKFPSPKNGKMMHWESHHELAGFQILEASACVQSYQEQPVEIHYILGSDCHTHIPDVYVEFVNGSKCFIEFKSQENMQDTFLVKRSDFLARNLPYLGYSYMVISNEQTGQQPHANSVTLNRYAERKIKASIKELFRRTLNKVQPLPIKALLARLPAHDNNKAFLYGLILSGDIALNMFSPISSDSIVTWSEER